MTTASTRRPSPRAPSELPLWGLIVSARFNFLSGGIALYAIGVLFGRGSARPLDVAIGIVAVSLVHIITHLVNDAEDVITDEQTSNPTLLNGGSRAIQRGLVTPAQLRWASLVLSVAVLVISIVAAILGQPLAALLFMAMLGLGYSYSGPPLMLGRHGLGELTAGLVMALFVPMAGALAAGGFTPGLWAVVPLLVAQTIFARFCTAFPDIEADRQTRKWTIPALAGPRGAAIAFAGIAAIILVIGLVVGPSLDAYAARRTSAIVVALAGFLIAALIATGRVERHPVIVPVIGFLAFGAGMVLIVVAQLSGAS